MIPAPVPRLAVIVVAAGSGTRLNGGAPKAFVGLDEHTILRHSLSGVFSAPRAQVVVVVPSGFEGAALTDAHAVAGDRRELVSVVSGGATRQSSVAAGLAALRADIDTVLVHDAARALTPPAVFDRVVAALDAVAHAIVDALLAAAGLGDIGTHFGVDRPEFAGAHAEAFLAHTRNLLAEAGWRIGNVSVQVQANRPRFAGRRAEAERALSAALGGAPVSVSATTTDGLGFTGRTEGVAAFATALVLPV